MQTRQSNTLESLHGVQTFLTANAERLGTIAATGMRQKLDAVVAEADALAAGQAGHGLVAKGSTQKQRALRASLLRDHMAPIAGVAQAELPRTPEIGPLLMPKGRSSADKLALHATAMAHAAAPFRELFVAAGLPADFVDQLGAATTAMLESYRQRSQTTGLRSGATKGLRAKLVEGRKIVRALDRFVTSTLRDDPTALANWKAVQRVRRVNRSAPVAPAVSTATTLTAA
jgi:hypothetical protein